MRQQYNCCCSASTAVCQAMETHKHNLHLEENVNEQIANLYAHLKKSDNHVPQFLALDREGITFTSNFLLGKLISTLATETGATKYSSDNFKAVKELIKK